MKCDQCGKRLLDQDYYQVLDRENVEWALCTPECLRAWVGPDRPFSEPVEQAQNARPQPQYVVVHPADIAKRRSESELRELMSRVIPAKYPPRQLR